MNTRRSTRNKVVKESPKRKHETDTDSSDSYDTSVVTIIPKNNPPQINKRKHVEEDDSSSDSSVGDYLKNPDEIDLSSSFFTSNINAENPDFGAIEKKIFGGIQHLSDSEESDFSENQQIEPLEIPAEKVNFSQLREYNKKLEEAKACVEKYVKNKKKVAKKTTENNHDISRLLKLGETKNETKNSVLQSDDSDSDDWQEIEEKDKTEDKINIPKDGVQITVELPQVIRQKSKGIDMMTAIKRRINRVKKENQVFVHKVHLLCWIAHGNYLNSILNDTELLGPALSLLPSDKCYPPKHADMSYLEQIVKWFGKKIQISSKKLDVSIKESLEKSISNKTVNCNRDFVLIFIIILRSLGLQCRLVLSLQCLPLRPPSSELCSLSTKTPNDTNKPGTSKSGDSKKSLNKSVVKNANPLNKSINNPKDKKTKTSTKEKQKNGEKTKPKEKSKPQENKKTQEKKATRSTTTKKKTSKEKKLSQVDGADDEETTKKRTRPNIRIKLKKNLNESTSSTSELATINNKNKNLLNVGDEDFKPKRRSPTNKSPKDINSNSNKTTTRSSKKTLSEKLEINKIKTDKSPTTKKIKSSPKPSTSTLTSSAKKLEENRIKTSPRSSSNYFQDKKIKTDVTNDIIKLIKGDMSSKRIAEEQKNIKTKIKIKKEEPDYDSDYFPDENEITEKPKMRKYNSEDDFKFKVNNNVKRKIKTKKEIDTRVISSDDEDPQSQDPGKKKKIGNDVWAEVFLEEEEKWISVDVIKGQIHCVSELFSRASQPVSYIIAWNNDQSLKDVTARYCPNWNTVTRKLRVDNSWWLQTLHPFLGVKTVRDKEEDEDLARQQLDKPLPTTISEYKNHPLYALKRHLLKFEGIYPPNAVTLGFIRNEAVYARECVHTLHSREIWVKHAKVVKPAQEPYKIVKARPKYDKLTGNMITDLPLELFGKWQVDDYVPPTAENGVVPRNAFGNVELFKACMLPKKTVHLQLPGLNKICRKLRIDCAPAVVGFDFHGGYSHPMFDGYVVCEEFKDTLIEAWEQDQIETAKREQEKYEKRVWGNWRKLIKAVLIRERLKARYDFGRVDTTTTSSGGGGSSKGKKSSSKGSKVVLKKRKICSDDEWSDVE